MENTTVIEHHAIEAAINSQWADAIVLNKKILAIEKYNADAYLRLAFAYLQSNKISEAKKQYKLALKLQPGSRAILESLERIKILESKKYKANQSDKILTLNPNLFLETPGKTKSIVLVNPGQKNVLADLAIGQKVHMIPKKRKIEIRSDEKEYVGSLPDDISKRLTIFIKAGSEFSAYIKEATLSKVIIFMREEKKGRKVMKYTSFPTNIQAKLTEMSHQDEESKEEDSEVLNDNDLDKLAEVLATEEKEYLPYQSEEHEEEQEE